jgi:hypothetical protein
VTSETLGVRINPHAFRYAAATSIAVSMPEKVKLVPYVLANDERTARESYELSNRISASYEYMKEVEARKKPPARQE